MYDNGYGIAPIGSGKVNTDDYETQKKKLPQPQNFGTTMITAFNSAINNLQVAGDLQNTSLFKLGQPEGSTHF